MTNSLIPFVSIPPTFQIFTSDGTWNKPIGLKKVKLRLVGGGGGGGGAPATGASQVSGGSGGSGGGYCEAWIDASTLANTESVIVGLAGAGASGLNGTNGSASSFGTCAAQGGQGGFTFAASGSGRIGSPNGGEAVGANINVNGKKGGVGWGTFTTVGHSISGEGACGPFSDGGGPVAATTANGGAGGDATGYGGGGGGAANGASQSARAGGNGSPGIVIIEEYY